MGNVPPIAPPVRLPLVIPVPGYLSDHLFEGQPVLPAVEAMEALARAVDASSPGSRVTDMENARFDRFLFIDPAESQIEAAADLQITAAGDIEAVLITRTTSPNAAITRTKAHARATFSQSHKEPLFVPLDMAAAPEGICFPVPADTIYRELVPFGPAYRNITKDLQVGPDGALAEIRCPDISEGGLLLGSPFPLDAAFHAACVWGQHYHNIVAFPVGIGERRILIPTQPGRNYFGRVFARASSPDLLRFDIFLFDEEGRLCEAAMDVQMRDPSGGRLRPPEWIMNQPSEDPLSALRHRCDDLAVVELSALAPFAPAVLSPLEKERFDKMGAPRKKSFLAGRMALKRLFRRKQEEQSRIDPKDIETVTPDSTKPCCLVNNIAPFPYLSVSHNARFAVAVCDQNPVGVDVEVISDRPLRSARIFMSDSEQILVHTSSLPPAEAAVRIWSVKEVVTKATGMPFPETWHRVEITSVTPPESTFRMDDDGPRTAFHATVDNHLFTLFISSTPPRPL